MLWWGNNNARLEIEFYMVIAARYNPHTCPLQQGKVIRNICRSEVSGICQMHARACAENEVGFSSLRKLRQNVSEPCQGDATGPEGCYGFYIARNKTARVSYKEFG